MILNNETVKDENGKEILIMGVDNSTPIPLTYDMIRISSISPSMVYQLIHGDGIYIGEDKWVRVYE